MAELEMTLRFEGPALETGRMSVRDLAPALLAMGEVFHEANLIVNPASDPVALDIKATTPGSFQLDLFLANPNVVSEGVRLLSSSAATALANLTAYVTALVGLTVWVHRRRVVSTEEPRPGITRITLENGDTLEIPTAVLDLYANPSIRKNIADAFRPVEKEGIERAELRQGDNPPAVVSKEDFAALASSPDVAEQQIVDRVSEIALKVVAPAFEGNYMWRFSDGERVLHAAIRDEAFLDRVENGEAFRKGDVLLCDLRHEQWLNSDGMLRNRYEVERVERHVPAPQVLALPFGDPAEEDS